MKTCKICTSPVREIRPGVFVHEVERPVKRIQFPGTLDFLVVETVPGIDYEQVEIIAREVKE